MIKSNKGAYIRPEKLNLAFYQLNKNYYMMFARSTCCSEKTLKKFLHFFSFK